MGNSFYTCDECLKCEYGHVLRGGEWMVCRKKKYTPFPPECPESKCDKDSWYNPRERDIIEHGLGYCEACGYWHK